MTDPKDTMELRAEALPTLYKVLHHDGRACHDGAGKWPLPADGEPGAWLEIKGKIAPCSHGLHLCREQDLLNWLGPAIFEAEHEGELIVHADGTTSSKVVARKARLIRRVETWNERTARLFAADCAERVLPIFERAHPHDDRPRRAIEAARAYARGEIGARARDAAGHDAWAAAWLAGACAAALSAARATGAASAAADAAARAASAAAARAIGEDAKDAAWAARAAAARAVGAVAARAIGEDAKDAAWAAERAWQTKRLL